MALVLTLAVPARAAWQLVWADEFAQADGSSPDSAKWGFDVGGGGWGNNQQEYDTARTNNARIQGGNLVIEAKQENYMGRSYTSARMLTKGKWSWTYGRMEARIKLPRGQGIWPAFWTLGANIDSVGWPACGEIDIMENIGKTNNNEQGKIYGTIHGPQSGGDYNGGAGVGTSYTLPGGAKYADGFHVFAIEWTTNQIKWFMDEVQYFTATPASLPSGGTWPFTQPQFILLNLAVGGNWPGYPSNYTVFPQQMLVDYVRVYAFSNAPPTTSGVLLNGNFENGLLAPWVGKDFANANPSGGVITDTNGLVWNPSDRQNAANTQNIKNPAVGMYACKIYGNYNNLPNTREFIRTWMRCRARSGRRRCWRVPRTLITSGIGIRRWWRSLSSITRARCWRSMRRRCSPPTRRSTRGSRWRSRTGSFPPGGRRI
ncbi:MAG: glycoside hydrolase family 16 protein [Verrucomicrobiota bacterium]